jgi:hypothetical protein
MSDRERLRRAEQSRRDRGSFTLDQWCSYRGISRAMYYKLPEQQRPRTHNVGVKVLISDEADLEWLRAREAETANQSETAA